MLIVLIVSLVACQASNAEPNESEVIPQNLEIGSTMIGEDGVTLVYVPEGEFTMGSDDNSDERPVHTVYVDAFWIGQTEVTNKQYQACEEAGVCESPSSTSSYSHLDYYGHPEFDNFPVVHITWSQAKNYCENWADGDLPTEAQWEKAARGTDARIYPWGNEAPNKDLLNHNSSVGDVTEAGSYKNGKSPYGVDDMAGNVWEWVNDWHDATYYQSSPSSNPLGPNSGQYRELRGGSWNDLDYTIRAVNRYGEPPTLAFSNIGFRCVLDASP